MAFKTQNAYGNITIKSEVIEKLAGFIATRCYGVVGMAYKNKTDGITSLLKKENLNKGVKVLLSNGEISITLHIISEYGVNINAISKNIIDDVKFNIESLTGATLKAVNVVVESIRVD